MKYKIPFGYVVLICEFCREKIGIFKPENLKVPMDSTMFESIDKHHNFPPPFPTIPGRGETLKWENAKCPFCRLRPFTYPDKVMTPTGFFTVGDERPPVPPTQSDSNQKRIAELWQQEQELSLTPAERNQREIEKAFPELPTVADKIIEDIHEVLESLTEAQRATVEQIDESDAMYGGATGTPGKQYICPVCGRDDIEHHLGFSSHVRSCKKKADQSEPQVTLQCPYCGLPCEGSKTLADHQTNCTHNPDYRGHN